MILMMQMMLTMIPMMQTTMKVGDAFHLSVVDGIFVQPACQLSNSLDNYALSIPTNHSAPYWMLVADTTYAG
jgi:hypothetical protein